MADAIEELRAVIASLKLPSLDSQAITIRAGLLEFPSGTITTTIALTIPGNKFGGIFAFALPSCMYFHAKNAIGTREKYSAADLNGAIVEAEGASVQLPNGVWIHAVEFVPMQAMPAFTRRRSRTLRQVIFALNAEDRCFRPVVSSLSDTVISTLHDTVALDFAAIQQERLPPLKKIQQLIFDDMPDVTRSALSEALAAAGLRRPRSGPRSANRTARNEP
jgi:hypothetical protein